MCTHTYTCAHTLTFQLTMKAVRHFTQAKTNTLLPSVGQNLSMPLAEIQISHIRDVVVNTEGCKL